MTDREWRTEMNHRQERYSEMAKELKIYERVQWKKAFLEGTDKAWKQYRANIKRRLTKIYKETGFHIDYDRFMAMI